MNHIQNFNLSYMFMQIRPVRHYSSPDYLCTGGCHNMHVFQSTQPFVFITICPRHAHTWTIHIHVAHNTHTLKTWYLIIFNAHSTCIMHLFFPKHTNIYCTGGCRNKLLSTVSIVCLSHRMHIHYNHNTM